MSGDVQHTISGGVDSAAFGGAVGKRQALTGSQLREAERRLVAMLRAKGFPDSWIERNVLDLLAQASEEYARWLDDHEPVENPADRLIACAYRSALNLPGEEAFDEERILSGQESRDLAAGSGRGGRRPVLRRSLIAGLAVALCGLVVSGVRYLPRHDDPPRPRLREQTHFPRHRRPREAVAIASLIPVGSAAARRPAHHRRVEPKAPEPAVEQIETEEGSSRRDGGGGGSAPVSPPPQETTPAPPPARSAADAQVREEFGL